MTIRKIASNVTLACWANRQVLFSYDTPVASWEIGKGYSKTSTCFSRTTSKHIARWLGDSHVAVVEQSSIDALCQ
jgi:hypothetical protein